MQKLSDKPDGGRFILYPDTDQEIVLENSLVSTGAEALLKELYQDAGVITDFYIGLMGEAYTVDTVLADIVGTSEPTIGTHNYARKQMTRNNTDWPDVSKVNGVWRAQTKLATFTATVGDYDRAIQRLFLATVLSGAGTLIAVSGLFPSPITVGIASPLPVKYERWMQ